MSRFPLIAAASFALIACEAPDPDAPLVPPGARDVLELGTLAAGGDIELHFTSPGVDSATGEDPPLDDQVASLFDEAAETLDISLFEFDRDVLVDAALAAVDAGVEVRFVGDGDEIHDEGYELLQGAGVEMSLRRPNDRIMHNKFAVIDGEWVITGSTNFSESGVLRNNNGTMFVRDPDLAEAYTAEFEQMFTGRLFGRQKSAVAAPPAALGGETIETHFSPRGDPAGAMLEMLDDADLRVFFFVFSFTRDDVADRLIALHEAGVQVVGIFDESQARSRYSRDDRLAAAGVPTFIDGNEHTVGFAGGKLHHKVMLVDAVSDSEPAVTVGSYNWSGSAADYNDENLMIVRGPEVSTAYLDEFCRILAVATPHPLYEGTVPDPCAGLLQQVRINEFMPNPEGTDAGQEWVELVNTGSAPVQLEGWRLGDSTRDDRHVFAAHALAPGQSIVVRESSLVAAEGAVVDASSGRLSLANNADEVVLRDAFGAVIDHIEYGSAASGLSFNRDPDGSEAGPFSDHDQVPGAVGSSSPGTRVTGDPWGPFQVLINEALPNPAGTDTPDEYVELFSYAEATVDLSGWTLGDASDPARHVFPAGTTLSPGAALVVFGAPHPGVPGSQAASTGNLSLNNSGETLTLYNAAGSVIDRVSWSSSTEAVSKNRNPDADPDGALVDHDDVPGASGGSSPGLRVDGAPFGAEVVVNEVMPDPAGTDAGQEWVELVNLSPFPADLDGWALGDPVNPARHVFAGTVIPAGGSLVVFDSGSHPEVPGSITSSTGTLSLNNSGDSVSLTDASGSTVSAVSWTGSTTGVSRNRAADGDGGALLVDHDEVAGAVGGSSPGTRVDGTAW